MPLQEIKRAVRPHLRSRAEARLYGVRFQPVFAQDLCHDLIDPPPLDKAVRAETPHLSIAGGGLCAAARDVAVEVRRLELAQRQLNEGIARTQLHHLASDALSPE